ncbi:hypothetical protein FISHEDRAFT_74689 [Fistulina hepatica ATCC 64428]|uniref:Uncharacterized protein n=1 Tax=Fistulina hepatica ATCC 64428 TaxID=1128425 RepID=A0A0D7AAG7_9AGAR|nr:hypothetical protein FISHEDRAFT_74689 [Fistulina hepatica ATCC 64428]
MTLVISRPPRLRERRTATSVMAGVFDVRPPRDVLTSLLNGVGPYIAVEHDDAAETVRRSQPRDKRKIAKPLKDKKEKQTKRPWPIDGSARLVRSPSDNAINLSVAKHAKSTSCLPIQAHMHTFQVRPTIHIAAQHSRSVSVTPPPSPTLRSSSPGLTPGPSVSSTTSRRSSKRPHTPNDDDPEFMPPPPKKERPKKGWKGWVLIDSPPPPSEKLINLDQTPVLKERRLRSGKNFDAISTGKDTWV